MINSYGIILISNTDKKFLVVQHPEGHRGFPKGQREKGEKGVNTALRELYEECDIIPNYIIKNYNLSEKYYVDNALKKVNYWIGYTNRNTLGEKRGLNSQWVSIDDLINFRKFLSKGLLSDLKTILKKEVILKYRKNTNKKNILSYHKIQGSKHAYSRVFGLKFLSKNIHFCNVPNILDIGILDEIEILSNNAGEGNILKIPPCLCIQSRSIIPILPGLISKHGVVTLTFPKGCNIGERKIDLYLNILNSFGHQISIDNQIITIYKGNNYISEIVLPFNSFTATSIAIIEGSTKNDKIIIDNISIEPEIIYLINTLIQLGVSIKFIGERRIEIKGINFKKIGKFTFRIPEDRNVIITHIIIALITKKRFKYQSQDNLYLIPFLLELDKLGIIYNYKNKSIEIDKITNYTFLKPTNIIANFYPGFCSDWQPLISILLTQIEGFSTITDLVFEDRYNYIKEIGKIINNFSFTIDNHKLNIFGLKRKKHFKKKIETINCIDLRSGAVNIISCLLSDISEIEIYNIHQINRGYENIIGYINSTLGLELFSYEYK